MSRLPASTEQAAADVLRAQVTGRVPKDEWLTMAGIVLHQTDALIGASPEEVEGEPCDMLFLNAGITTARGVVPRDVPDSEINQIFLTNGISPIRVAAGLARHVAPGGMIAFMSSILGSVSTNDDGRAELYLASKAALNSPGSTFRARHAADDVTVLALHPGVVPTSMGGKTRRSTSTPACGASRM